jgi:hypothetical protein
MHLISKRTPTELKAVFIEKKIERQTIKHLVSIEKSRFEGRESSLKSKKFFKNRYRKPSASLTHHIT